MRISDLLEARTEAERFLRRTSDLALTLANASRKPDDPWPYGAVSMVNRSSTDLSIALSRLRMPEARREEQRESR